MEKNEEKLYEEKYMIYEYFNKHHSLLIASISAVVAVGSLATNVLIYIYQCITLHYWNVPIEFMGVIREGNFFYIAIIGMLYYFTIPIYQMHIQKIFCEHLVFFPLIKLEKKLLKKIKENNEKKDIRKKLLNIKKQINAVRWNVFFKMVYMIISASLLFSVFFALFQISVGDINKKIFFVGGVFILLILIITFCYSTRSYNRSIKALKKREKDVIDVDEAFNMLDEIGELQKNKAKEFNSVSLNKEILCDKKICKFAFHVIMAFMSVCAFFIVSGFVSPRTKKGFWVYRDELEQNYVVICQNEEQVILEKAFITDNTISININELLFASYEEKEFKYIEFKDVMRIRN